MPQTQDRLTLAVSSALGAALFLSAMNMLSKWLGATLNPVEITFWRNLIAVIPLLIGLLILRRFDLLKTGKPIGQLWRACIGTIGIILGVWSLEYLPLSEAVAYGFTAPLFVVLLSMPLLGERVGWRRILATLIGFCGIFVILGQHPLDLTLNIGAMIALAASFCNALVLISLRWLGRTENSITTVFYFLSFGLIGTAIAMPFLASPVQHSDYGWILALGLVGLLSLILKTESYRHAPAAVVAPISYVLILMAGFWDWLIWETVPGWNIWLGAAVIMGSNLFILYREHKLNREGLHPRG